MALAGRVAVADAKGDDRAARRRLVVHPDVDGHAHRAAREKSSYPSRDGPVGPMLVAVLVGRMLVPHLVGIAGTEGGDAPGVAMAQTAVGKVVGDDEPDVPARLAGEFERNSMAALDENEELVPAAVGGPGGEGEHWVGAQHGQRPDNEGRRKLEISTAVAEPRNPRTVRDRPARSLHPRHGASGSNRDGRDTRRHRNARNQLAALSGHGEQTYTRSRTSVPVSPALGSLPPLSARGEVSRSTLRCASVLTPDGERAADESLRRTCRACSCWRS